MISVAMGRNLATHSSYEVKEFQDGRVDKVVATSICNESFDHRTEQVLENDVAIVEFVF